MKPWQEPYFADGSSLESRSEGIYADMVMRMKEKDRRSQMPEKLNLGTLRWHAESRSLLLDGFDGQPIIVAEYVLPGFAALIQELIDKTRHWAGYLGHRRRCTAVTGELSGKCDCGLDELRAYLKTLEPLPTRFEVVERLLLNDL